MPRTARRQSETSIYHAIVRGINQQRIFEEAADYRQFLSILVKVKAVSQFKLYAYCLMGNHVHLLLEEINEPLCLVFKRLGSIYPKLRKSGMPIRQIARITGASKGVVERWIAKNKDG